MAKSSSVKSFRWIIVSSVKCFRWIIVSSVKCFRQIIVSSAKVPSNRRKFGTFLPIKYTIASN